MSGKACNYNYVRLRRSSRFVNVILQSKFCAQWAAGAKGLSGAGGSGRVDNPVAGHDARTSAPRARQRFQLAPEAVAVRSRLVDANAAAADLLGYDTATLRKMSLLDLHKDKDREKVLGNFATLLEVGRLGTERRMKKHDGRLVWVSFDVVKVSDQLYLGYCQDITERKRTERDLRESEAILREMLDKVKESETQYRALFEAMTEGVAFHEIVYDERGMAVDYRIISTNRAFEKHTGMKSEHVFGELASKIFCVDEAPYLERFAQVASSGEPDSFETYFPPLNRFFHISATSPKRGCFVIVFENITERKRTEDALKESRQHLANIIDFLPDATLVINSAGEVIAWNKAIEEMTGVKASDMLGKGNHEYALPFYGERRPILADLVLRPQEEILSKYAETARRRNEIVGEASMPALRIGETCLYGTASVLRDSSGNVVGAIQSIRDITENKRAQNALRESEERFSRFFRASPMGTSILRLTDNQFADVNDAFLDLFGYTRKEVIAQNPLELGIWVDPEDRVRMFELLRTLGRIRDFETRFQRKSGEIMDVRFSAEVIEAAGQQYLLGLTHDITAHKRAEQEKKTLEGRLRQAQKLEAIGTLAGGIAHDFNNILQPMIGYTEMALSELSPSNPMREDLEQALNASLRAKELVRQILSVSRSTQEQQRIPLDIGPIFKEALKLLRSSLPASIRIRQSIRNGVALADPTRIHQVLMNLCTNAAHAMGDKGIMEVRLSPVDLSESDLAERSIVELAPGPYLELSVSDTGAGMDAQTIERIFEPYFTTKEVGKGSGLGLAVVHGIVKRHNGAISVKARRGRAAPSSSPFPG